MIESVKQYLENFLPLSEEEWQLFKSMMVPHQLNKGDILLKEGEVCDKLFFLTSGLIRKYEIVRKKEITLHFYSDQQFVSVFDSFLKKEPSSSFLQALEVCEGFSISHENVYKLYQTDQKWERIGRLIAEGVYVRELNRVRMLLSYNSTELYERMLIEGTDWLGRVHQKYIASYLGISPESLSRLRKKFQN